MRIPLAVYSLPLTGIDETQEERFGEALPGKWWLAGGGTDRSLSGRRGRRPGAEDLRAASAATVAFNKHVPAFYGVLNGYPASRPPELEERFLWVSYEAHGTPVVILTHAMSLATGNAYAVCQRQFYVSGGYNVEQAVAGFLPVTGWHARRLPEPYLDGPDHRLRGLEQASHRP